MKAGIILVLAVTIGLWMSVSGTGKTGEPSCSDCHSVLLQPAFLHKPLNRGCTACHKSTGITHPKQDEKGFGLTSIVPELCYSCHDSNNTKEYVHPPVANGKCLSCHSPHSADNEALLKIAPVSKLCEECHDLELADKKVKHQPAVIGNCMACHDPHQSDNKKLFSMEMPDACLKCHETTRQEMNQQSVHSPFKRNCTVCHSGHGSNESHILKSSPPDLCTGCHEEIQEVIDQSAFPHQAMKIKQGCTNCHSAHASPQNYLLVAEETKVCVGCHNRSVSAGSNSVVNMKQLLQSSRFIHGAITKKGCSTCHSPHGGNNRNLLTDAFPAGNYAAAVKDSFALCFKCHDSKLLEKESGIGITGFRNGEKNLHFVHVNAKKGRSCLNCHNVHAAMNEQLIADKVNYGKWDMPVGFKSIEGGGTCSPGCHSTKEYKR